MTDIFLYDGEANPNDIKLRDPTVADSGGIATVTGAGGLASAEAFGQPTVSYVVAVVGAAGISSGEAFGQPTVTFRWPVVAAGGIASTEVFGQPTVTYGWPVVGAGGIDSAEMFGQPTVVSVGGATQAPGGRRRRRRRLPDSLPQYTPFVVPLWHQVTGAGGITSAEAFGLPTITIRRNVRRRREEEIQLLAA